MENFFVLFFVLFWLNNLLINHASESAKKTNTCHTKYNIQFDLNDLLLVVELPTNTFKIRKWSSRTDFLVKAAKGNEASFNAK